MPEGSARRHWWVEGEGELPLDAGATWCGPEGIKMSSCCRAAEWESLKRPAAACLLRCRPSMQQL
jgi:hypothetical protein